jgi:hypothetical protein
MGYVSSLPVRSLMRFCHSPPSGAKRTRSQGRVWVALASVLDDLGQYIGGLDRLVVRRGHPFSSVPRDLLSGCLGTP